MMVGCILDEWEYVGCPSRLGHIVKDGPVTGKQWEIIPTGSWIDADDAAALCETREDIWCFRTNGYINVHVVFKLNPSADDMKRRPSNGQGKTY